MSTGSAQVAVRDNSAARRYELVVEGDVVGELLYRAFPDRIVLVHTEVLSSVEGRGFGARLVAGALDDIRARGLRVVPMCPFVHSYIRRHPEYDDLVVTEEQASS
jgi:predicted GNAT family acetyltransferase